MDRSYIPAHVPDQRKKYYIRNAIDSAKDVSFPWPGHLWPFTSEKSEPTRSATSLVQFTNTLFFTKGPNGSSAASSSPRTTLLCCYSSHSHSLRDNLVSFDQGIFGSPSSSEHPSPGALRVIIWSSINFSRALHRSGFLVEGPKTRWQSVAPGQYATLLLQQSKLPMRSINDVGRVPSRAVWEWTRLRARVSTSLYTASRDPLVHTINTYDREKSLTYTIIPIISGRKVGSNRAPIITEDRPRI